MSRWLRRDGTIDRPGCVIADTCKISGKRISWAIRRVYVVIEDLQTITRILKIRGVDGGYADVSTGIYCIDRIVVAEWVTVDRIVEQAIRRFIGNLWIQVYINRIGCTERGYRR